MPFPFLHGLGPTELIIILVVVLVIFGPKNLPKLGGAIGKTFKSMRDGMEGAKEEDAPKKTEDASEDAKSSTKEVPSETADSTDEDAQEATEPEKTA